jgi:hypothetical protein
MVKTIFPEGLDLLIKMLICLTERLLSMNRYENAITNVSNSIYLYLTSELKKS